MNTALEAPHGILAGMVYEPDHPQLLSPGDWLKGMLPLLGRTNDRIFMNQEISTCLMKCLVGMLILGIAACRQEAKLSPLPKDAVILAFGDSLTYGTGTDAMSAYPKVLEGMVGREVVNVGIPGEITAQGLRRLPEELEAYRPALVILMEGGNDFLRRHSSRKTRENLSAMIRLIRASGSEVVLVGVPAPGLVLSSAHLYEELAEELKVPYLDGVMADILSERALKSDPIHPNGEGYWHFAKSLADFLKERGAIR